MSIRKLLRVRSVAALSAVTAAVLLLTGCVGGAATAPGDCRNHDPAPGGLRGTERGEQRDPEEVRPDPGRQGRRLGGVVRRLR